MIITHLLAATGLEGNHLLEDLGSDGVGTHGGQKERQEVRLNSDGLLACGRGGNVRFLAWGGHFGDAEMVK